MRSHSFGQALYFILWVLHIHWLLYLLIIFHSGRTDNHGTFVNEKTNVYSHCKSFNTQVGI